MPLQKKSPLYDLRINAKRPKRKIADSIIGNKRSKREKKKRLREWEWEQEQGPRFNAPITLNSTYHRHRLETKL